MMLRAGRLGGLDPELWKYLAGVFTGIWGNLVTSYGLDQTYRWRMIASALLSMAFFGGAVALDSLVEDWNTGQRVTDFAKYVKKHLTKRYFVGWCIVLAFGLTLLGWAVIWRP